MALEVDGMKETPKTLVCAITGASGSLYGVRLVGHLLAAGATVHLITSTAGRAVMRHELGTDHVETAMASQGFSVAASRLLEQAPEDFFTPPASGSFRHDGMVIAPCSMKTVAGIANGFADGLIGRAADVALKEKRPLILVPRETPFNRIHLENLVKLDGAGATILPAVPSFYTRPQTVEALVDTVLARVLDHLGISQTLHPEWTG